MKIVFKKNKNEYFSLFQWASTDETVMATKKNRFYRIFFDGLQPLWRNYKEMKEPTLKSNKTEKCTLI